MSSVALSSHMPFPFQRLPPSGLPSPGPHRKVFSTKCGLLLPFSNARRPAVVSPSKRRSICQFRALTRSRRLHFPTQRPIRLLKPWPPARAPSKPRALSLYHIRTTISAGHFAFQTCTLLNLFNWPPPMHLRSSSLSFALRALALLTPSFPSKQASIGCLRTQTVSQELRFRTHKRDTGTAAPELARTAFHTSEGT